MGISKDENFFGIPFFRVFALAVNSKGVNLNNLIRLYTFYFMFVLLLSVLTTGSHAFVNSFDSILYYFFCFFYVVSFKKC